MRIGSRNSKKHLIVKAVALTAISIAVILSFQNCSQTLSGDSTPRTLSLSSTGNLSRALTVTLVNVPANYMITRDVAAQGVYIQVTGAVGAVTMVPSIGSVSLVSQTPPMGLFMLPVGATLATDPAPVTVVVQDSGTPIASQAVTFTITSSLPLSATPTPTPIPTPIPAATMTFSSPRCGGVGMCAATGIGDPVGSANVYCQSQGFASALTFAGGGPGGAICGWNGSSWGCDSSCSHCTSMTSVTCTH
jgi:hypothetical protein